MIPWLIISALILACTAGYATAQGDVDSAFLQGARGMVPCNDGSFIGGFINCPTFVNGNALADCPRPVMTRSSDGGKTWILEEAQTQDYSFPEIVRLKGGVLLTGHNRWLNSFILSSDNGHTWSNGFDTTAAEPLDDYNYISFNLFRDHRGILYWKGGGHVNMSLDNGHTFCALFNSNGNDGFYVLPPDGLIASHFVGSGNLPGEISMSFNHGRSWSVTLRGHDRYQDSVSMLYGAINIRDTVFADDDFGYYPDGSWLYVPKSRTKYWNRATRTWELHKHLGGFVRTALMDSSENFYTDYINWIYLKPSSDTVNHLVSVMIPPDSIPNSHDSLLYTYYREIGLIYDLDGAIHPCGSDIYFPIRALRPISKLDRLYTCTGVDYVIGGHVLDSVMLVKERSSNAALTYTTTPNKRLAMVSVTAIDSTMPMKFTIVVTDSVVRNQFFTDSVLPNASLPVISITNRFGRQLECNWPDGPFMWMRNGEPLPKPSLGMNNDSVVADPKPGTYYVVGRNPFGCDVRSNELKIVDTDVNDDGTESDANYATFIDADGNIQIRWNHADSPTSIQVFDLLGREIETVRSIQHHQATVLVQYPRQTCLLRIQGGTSYQTTIVMMCGR